METREVHVRVRTEGGHWATVDEFPGVSAAGDTTDELRISLTEGISLWLVADDRTAPQVTVGTFETVDPLEQASTVELTFA